MLILIIFTSWTVSLGQSQINDSVACYNQIELRKIANKLLLANEYDTLLKISELQLAYKDSIISKQNLIINSLNTSMRFKDEEISIYKDNLKIERKNTQSTKLKSSALIILILGIFLLK